MAEECIVVTKTNEKLIKRMMTWDDLEAVESLAKTEDYNMGLHNLKLYYETSPTTWNVVVNEKGELIAYDTYNRLPVGEMRHGFQVVVREDYRGKGITRFFETMHYAKFPGVGNATANSLLRYKFERYGDKLVGYGGMIPGSGVETVKPIKQADFSIDSLEASKLDEFLNYDHSIIGFNRDEFIKEWVTAKKYPCYTKTLVAYRNDKICGYGTIRECSGYMNISPLYADEEIIAEWLLYRLLESLPVRTYVFLYFPAKNRFLTYVAHKLNLVCTDTELRDYLNNMPKKDIWDMSRVYLLHDYYPV